MKIIQNENFFIWAEEELSDHKKIRIKIKGNSMYPLLRNNQDEVLLRPYKAELLRRKDIVLFKYRGKYILHRFIRRKNGYLVMQGDNIFRQSEQCAVQDVIGIVENIYRLKSKGHIAGYKIISPRSPKWNGIIFLWKLKCRAAGFSGCIKRKLFR